MVDFGNEGKDFNLVIKALIEKGGGDLSMLPMEKIKEFEAVAERYVKNGAIIEAIQVYIMTKNKTRLIELGNLCLKQNKNEYAFEAFRAADDKKGLIDVGNAFLGDAKLLYAYKAYKLSGDRELVDFFEKNYKEGIDYYI